MRPIFEKSLISVVDGSRANGMPSRQSSTTQIARQSRLIGAVRIGFYASQRSNCRQLVPGSGGHLQEHRDVIQSPSFCCIDRRFFSTRCVDGCAKPAKEGYRYDPRHSCLAENGDADCSAM
jgi:hypothetical protein